MASIIQLMTEDGPLLIEIDSSGVEQLPGDWEYTSFGKKPVEKALELASSLDIAMARSSPKYARSFSY